MEVYYMINGGFMTRGQLLDRVAAMRRHHVSICHGWFDSICRPQAAYQLSKDLEKVMDDPNKQLQLGSLWQGLATATPNWAWLTPWSKQQTVFATGY